MSHTAGPWYVKRGYKHAHIRTVVGDRPVVQPHFGAVRDEDALLIAAAPDLFTACQTLVKYATTCDGLPANYEAVLMAFVEDGSTLTECLDAARAALAKAEGQA